MPLPSIEMHGAKLCTARSKRTGLPCKNPAAFGCKTCKVHGARKNVLKGKNHPNWRHGERSKQSMEQNSSKLCQLRNLEKLGYEIGIMSGPRMRGRKPRAYGD